MNVRLCEPSVPQVVVEQLLHSPQEPSQFTGAWEQIIDVELHVNGDSQVFSLQDSPIFANRGSGSDSVSDSGSDSGLVQTSN